MHNNENKCKNQKEKFQKRDKLQPFCPRPVPGCGNTVYQPLVEFSVTWNVGQILWQRNKQDITRKDKQQQEEEKMDTNPGWGRCQHSCQQLWWNPLGLLYCVTVIIALCHNTIALCHSIRGRSTSIIIISIIINPLCKSLAPLKRYCVVLLKIFIDSFRTITAFSFQIIS